MPPKFKVKDPRTTAEQKKIKERTERYKKKKAEREATPAKKKFKGKFKVKAKKRDTTTIPLVNKTKTNIKILHKFGHADHSNFISRNLLFNFNPEDDSDTDWDPEDMDY